MQLVCVQRIVPPVPGEPAMSSWPRIWRDFCGLGPKTVGSDLGLTGILEFSVNLADNSLRYARAAESQRSSCSQLGRDELRLVPGNDAPAEPHPDRRALQSPRRLDVLHRPKAQLETAPIARRAYTE
jgi:hypothetical protein